MSKLTKKDQPGRRLNENQDMRNQEQPYELEKSHNREGDEA